MELPASPLRDRASSIVATATVLAAAAVQVYLDMRQDAARAAS